MGRVVAATDTALDRTVAIKQALVDAPASLSRFEAEVRITAQLEHPSIVPIYDVGHDVEGRPYYVMRRIEGQPLSDRVALATTTRERLGLVPNMLAAVDAVAFAHARHIIHRDIKPWNILVGAYGETLVIDWGLARRLDTADPGTGGTAYGTPGYIAPEQARGEPGDPRTDVYALGATLFHVLTGGPPFGEASSQTIWLEAAARGLEPPLAKLGPEVPRDLVAIVGRAMASAAADRYGDAGELAADLRAFLAGQLVEAHRYTPFERVVRFVRRHRVAISVAVAAVIAIVVVGILAIVNVVRERDQAQLARRDAEVARIDAEASQRLAAARAEINLLDRASTLATRDPTHAVALLRGISDDPRYLARARDIASAAAASGIAHGKTLHHGLVTALQFAPDGHHLLSASKDGSIQVLDVATGASHEVVPPEPGGTMVRHVSFAVWTDAGTTITYTAGAAGLYVVEVSSTRVRALEPDAAIDELWTPGADDRVRYHDFKRNVLVERPTREAAPATILARDVWRAIGDGDVALVAGPGVVRVIEAGRERVLLHHAPTSVVSKMALSWDRSRCVVAGDDAVIEWNLATGVELHRWPLRPDLLFYVGNAPFALRRGAEGTLERLAEHGAQEVMRGEWQIAWTTRADRGIAIASAESELAFVEDGGTYRIPLDRQDIRRVAGLGTSPFVATGSSNGTITWWDLRAVIPQRVPVVPLGELCAVDDKYLFTYDSSKIVATPRAGGAPLVVMKGPVMACVADGGGQRVAGWGLDGSAKVIEIATLASHHAQTLVVDRDRTYLEVVERTVYELPLGGPPIARWTAPAEIDRVVSNTGWLAVELVDRRIARIERRSGTFSIVTPPGPIDGLAIDAGGTAWFAIGSAIYQTDGARIELVTTLPVATRMIAGVAEGLVIQGADFSIWTVTARGAINLATPASRGRRLWVGDRVAVTLDDARIITTYYLDTGERVTRPASSHIASSLAVAEHDRTLAVYVSMRPWIELYTDAVPGDPAKLRAWIDTATNAQVDPTSDALTWR